MTRDPQVPEEQQVYADWLRAGTRAGLAVLIVCFLAYASGVVAPHIPLERLPQLWSLPVDRYLEAAGAPAGWGWLRLAARADFMNFAGAALLALVTLACYLRLLVALARRGDWVFAGIAAAEIAVLAAAASGVIGAVH